MNYDFYTNRSRRLFLSGYPLEVIDMNNRQQDMPDASCHSHDEIELQYITEGHVNVTCDDNNIYAKNGEIIFINNNVEHFVTFTDEPARMFSIIIHPSFILDFEQLELKSKYVNPVICDRDFSHAVVTSDTQNYKSILEPVKQIISLNLKKEEGYELLSRACALQSWNVIYGIYSKSANFRKSLVPSAFTSTALQDEQRVRLACTYIHEHFTEPITLGDISDSILVSKSECCRCFKRVCELSPFEYLMKYRIVQATKLMQTSIQKSISDIAGSVGFNNTSYFNKVFKKFMNCTPSDYRRSLYYSPQKD
jgi:AraC-like DNA-binding protein